MAPTFIINRVDDKSLLEFFLKAESDGENALANEKEAGTKFLGSGHQIDFTLNTGLPWELTEEEILSGPVGQFVIASATLVFSSQTNDGRQTRREQISFNFKRGDNNSLSDSFTLHEGSYTSSMKGDGEQAVLKAIHKALSPLLRPVVPEDGGLIPTLSNLAQTFSTTYQGISIELSEAVAAVSKERSKQLNEFNEERKRLREEIAQERAEWQKEIQKELDFSREEIGMERRKLDEEWSKLEVSSHKDARRKQFAKLQSDLQETLQTPVVDRGLRQTRWAIFFALLAAAGAAGYFAYLTISAPPLAGDTTASWLLPAIKTTILTFTSLAAFLGASAWLRYFYMRDMNTQEEMRRFSNDMARASWVMDAALEIRKEHDEAIPPEWISGVTDGLFAAQKKGSLEEGAQALAALVGLSASTSIGPNGTTVEIGKKGSKVLSAAAKE